MKRQTGNYTKTPIALALAAMLSVLANGAQAQNAATEGLNLGQLEFVAAETEKNTVYKDVLEALKTIEDTTKAARTNAPEDNSGPPLGVLISLSQQGTGNEIDITATDSTLVINSVDDYLQDSTNSAVGNTFTANINASVNNEGEDGGGNVVYLSQKGNSTFTLNITGDSNQVMLSEFGGQTGLEEAFVNIYSSNNEVEIYRQGAALSGAADKLELDISGSSSDNVVVLGYDAFSGIVGKINSGSSYVTVVQDKADQIGPADSSYNNYVTFTIDDADGGSGLFDLRQLGIGNQLTLVANGANNDIRIDQRNTAGGINKMTLNVVQDNSTFDISANGTNNYISIDQSNTAGEGTVDGISKMTLDVDQSNSTIDISQAGPSTSVISLTGDGNAISVNNSKIGDSESPIVTNVSLTNTGTMGNSVTLNDYRQVGTEAMADTGVIVSGEGNTLTTTGDIGTFTVTGDRNNLMVNNIAYHSDTAGLTSISIKGSDNIAKDGLKTYSMYGDVEATYKIDGDNNKLNTSFDSQEGGTFEVTVNNKEAGSSALGNNITIDSGWYQSFKLDIQGDNNSYDFQARAHDYTSVSSYIKGSGNTQKFLDGSIIYDNDVVPIDITTRIVGHNNSWYYGVGTNGFSHTVDGDGFAGEVTANTSSGGYKQSFSQLGSGTSSLTHSGGTVKISTMGSALGT